jgi:glycosyltransferase involved in cell wall biosynthesis
MKLVVIIPCLNEEKTLKDVLNTIPKKIPGINKTEIVVIDDGSTDKTLQVAKKHGVKHFVIHHSNMGLARSFSDGLDKALSLGADIIVNTDGDNQYPQEDIPRLIKPILDDKADMVIADRQTHLIKYFPFYKKLLQNFGSFVASLFAGVEVPDAVSGFRAYSKNTAMRLNVFTDYTYTLETLIQAGKRKKRIAVIKIKVRPKAARRSRLVNSIPAYLKISAGTILRVFAIYEPLKVFSYIAFFIALPGIILILRFVILFLTKASGGHVQSLIIGSILITIGFSIGIIGIAADLIAINRRLDEDILYRLKRLQAVATEPQTIRKVNRRKKTVISRLKHELPFPVSSTIKENNEKTQALLTSDRSSRGRFRRPRRYHKIASFQ